jgi:hypothetical protein
MLAASPLDGLPPFSFCSATSGAIIRNCDPYVVGSSDSGAFPLSEDYGRPFVTALAAGGFLRNKVLTAHSIIPGGWRSGDFSTLIHHQSPRQIRGANGAITIPSHYDGRHGQLA